MTWRVRLAQPARADLTAILDTSGRDFGPAAARRYAAGFRGLVDRIAERPDRVGSVAWDHLRPSLRSLHLRLVLPRGRHVMFYRVTGARELTVLRILHDAMDPISHLSEPAGPDIPDPR